MAERAALPQPGATIAEKYRIERAIGSGGMSVVFVAAHVVTGKRFAIKWLAPVGESDLVEAAQRFIREAQVAGRFHHPNVVEVYDVGETGGAHYMVMEWLEGETLGTRLEHSGPLSFARACEYLVPCMRAIDEAHAAGIVHRDLKPANIFICSANKHGPERAKVLDFGIAKLSALSPGEISPVVTKSGVLIGTPYYLAPEQLRNLPADPRSDVYAFGVMLYQVLSGELPFAGKSFGALVLEIATGTPVPLRELVPTLPAGVEAVVARAMAREPAERFHDLRGLIAALEGLLAPVAQAAAASSLPSALPLVNSLATESFASASSQQLSAATRIPGIQKGWSRWAWLAAAAAVIAAVIRLYALQSQPTAVRGPATAPVDATVNTDTSAASEPAASRAQPSAAETAGAAAHPVPSDTPIRLEPAAVVPRVEPVATPPARRSKLRSIAAPARSDPTPAAPPETPEPDDHNPLHMKIQ